MSMKVIYRKLLAFAVKVFGVPFSKKVDALVRFRRKINLKKPVTLADKLCYLELFTDNPLKVSCTDKYQVREYVAGKGHSDILVPLCHETCSDVNEINFDALPQSFAMKATHGCGMNLICADKSALTEDQVRATAERWLKEDYHRACIEPHYLKIPHRIIFEEFLMDSDQIVDYKIFCFHGQPNFVEVCSNRASGLKIHVYTLDWEPLDVVVSKKKSDRPIPRPKQLERMIEISRQLSADFDFVRVDLYEIHDKIYFGELTFSPAAGVLPSFTPQFVAQKGALLQLP